MHVNLLKKRGELNVECVQDNRPCQPANWDMQTLANPDHPALSPNLDGITSDADRKAVTETRAEPISFPLSNTISP